LNLIVELGTYFTTPLLFPDEKDSNLLHEKGP